jgi:hypothetical protein
VLAVLTVFGRPFSALLAVLCNAVVRAVPTVRSFRRERASLDGYLMNIRDKYDSIIGVLCGA